MRRLICAFVVCKTPKTGFLALSSCYIVYFQLIPVLLSDSGKGVFQQDNGDSSIPRKTIEGYQNSFDYITFEKIISKKSIFVFDRTTNLQFSKMQSEIYG